MKSGLLLGIIAWLVAIIALAWTLKDAHAEPPPGASGVLSGWYHSLEMPGSGVSCCGAADCRPALDLQIKDGVYWVRDPSSGDMISVPPEHVLQREDNPTGNYIACIHAGMVLCFIRAPGT